MDIENNVNSRSRTDSFMSPTDVIKYIREQLNQ